VGGYKLKETISSKRVDTVVLGQEKIPLLLKKDYHRKFGSETPSFYDGFTVKY
jgi:hypothetical protein